MHPLAKSHEYIGTFFGGDLSPSGIPSYRKSGTALSGPVVAPRVADVDAGNDNNPP
jgi:hypothetical protein